MLETGCFMPSSLFELSIKFIFSVDCKESMSNLRQLSYAETIEAAILVRRKMVSFSKYETISESASGGEMFPDSWVKFCDDNYFLSNNPQQIRVLTDLSKRINGIVADANDIFSEIFPSNIYDAYWSSHPMYQVIYTESSADIIKNYQNMKSHILSLPDPPSIEKDLMLPLLPSSEEIYYYDPLCFFPICIVECGSPAKKRMCNAAVILPRSLRFIDYAVLVSISNLKESRGKISKILYCLSMASLFQINRSISSLVKSFLHRNALYLEKVEERDRLIMSSLNVIICLRNFINYVSGLEKTIFSAIKICNFFPLEDMKEMFERRDPYLCRNEIKKVSSFLKKKYFSLISRKKLRADDLVKKISENKLGNNSKFLSVSVENATKSLRKLNNEIREMEMFLLNFTD
ncbi:MULTISPECIES: hypothetical protein [Candidatus Ichthyocystis]|uniref:Putative coiled coil protein n=1 Tax=Candidatus Ichthyocystis hellenicum TaxID=1561003 RepID=A0A0S4M2Z4_9BURK|nr:MULTISPECIES: hypothetical protein [Ichthyocystis]CUT18149.1 putative coiled coil protein [Candidatus Ichthyocystis hellenicum]